MSQQPEKHTPGPWQWTFFCQPDGSPIESVQDVANTIASSAHFSPRAELFGVTLGDADRNEDGRSTVVCYTGNGPNAHNNARLIAEAPAMADTFRRWIVDCDTRKQHGAVLTTREGQFLDEARALLARIDGEATHV